MNKKMLFVAGVFGACLFAIPAMAQAQDDNIGAAMERDAQARRDSDTSAKAFDKDGNPDSAFGEESSSDSVSGNSSSRSSSSSASFGFGERRGRGNGSWSVDSVLGRWTLGDKNGPSTCTLTLSSDESFGLRQAWTNVGCPDGFFSVNRWRAAGRDLQLTDMGGNVIGSFRQVGPGRFEGWRNKDGAPMFLMR